LLTAPCASAQRYLDIVNLACLLIPALTTDNMEVLFRGKVTQYTMHVTLDTHFRWKKRNLPSNDMETQYRKTYTANFGINITEAFMIIHPELAQLFSD